MQKDIIFSMNCLKHLFLLPCIAIVFINVTYAGHDDRLYACNTPQVFYRFFGSYAVLLDTFDKKNHPLDNYQAIDWYVSSDGNFTIWVTAVDYGHQAINVAAQGMMKCRKKYSDNAYQFALKFTNIDNLKSPIFNAQYCSKKSHRNFLFGWTTDYSCNSGTAYYKVSKNKKGIFSIEYEGSAKSQDSKAGFVVGTPFNSKNYTVHYFST